MKGHFSAALSSPPQITILFFVPKGIQNLLTIPNSRLSLSLSPFLVLPVLLAGSVFSQDPFGLSANQQTLLPAMMLKKNNTEERHKNIYVIFARKCISRKIKLGSKTTGQRLNRALHAFHRLYQSQFFWWSFYHRVDKTLLLSASVKTLKLTYLHAKLVSSWLGLSIPRPRGHS